MTRKRQNHEPPPVISREGWRYHHLGIPTTVSHPGERHLAHLKVFVCGFESSPFGIEWMRFEPECEVDELIRRVPHVAFEVDDLESALKGRKLLRGITSPSRGVRVAMIVDNGAPIELIEFDGAEERAPAERRGRIVQRQGARRHAVTNGRRTAR